MTSAGQLRDRVAFESRTQTDDGAGNVVSGPWTEQFRCWAEIEPLTGRESVLAARLAGVAPANIRIRYTSESAAVTTDWRVRDLRADTIYNIRDIADTERRKRILEMLCDQGVAT